MQGTHEVGENILEWRHIALFKQIYELYTGDVLLATLRWTSAWKNMAVIESADGSWSFQPQGFFRSRILIYDANTNMEVASFKGNMCSKGVLTWQSGRSLSWSSTGFWRNGRAWSNTDGLPQLQFKSGGKQVTVEPSVLSQPEIVLLSALGFYLCKTEQNNTDAAVAASTM